MGLGAVIGTTYGEVIGGEYAKCRMGLGTDSGKTFEINPTPNVLVFNKGFKEVARVSTNEVAEFKTLTEDIRMMTIEIKWKKGTKSTVQIPKVDSTGKFLDKRVTQVITALSNHD